MLNDKDKEYLKNNVEKKLTDIDKKIDVGVNKASDEAKKVVTDPNSKFGKKLKEIYDKQNEKSDRDKYIDELIEKQDKGESTIADKVELLKAQLDKKLPDDFKEGMKAMTDTMKKGGNQAMQGVSHLVGRAMMSNPLTAMIWQNKDILKAVGDVGLGGLKMGLGALGALGKGTAGLLKASVNLFKKKTEEDKKETEEKEDEVSQEAPMQAENVAEEDDQTPAEKLAELHEAFFKDVYPWFEKKEKQEKEKTNILTKGLAGLGKSMKAISEVVEVIMAKQKLILGGLMLGAVGILALVGWFKGGDFEKMLKGAWNSLTDNGETAENQTNNMVDDTNVASFKPETTIELTKQQAPNGVTTKLKEQQHINNLWDWAGNPVESRKMKQKYNFSGATSDLLGESVHLAHGGLNADVKTYKNEGNIKIAFPVSIKMLDVRFDESAGQGASALIEKAEVTKGNKERLRYASGTMPRLIVTNIKKLLIPKKTVIKPNTTLFIVGEEYQLIGDLAAFMRGEIYEEYTNKNNKDSSLIDKKYLEQANDKIFKENLVKSEKDYMKQTSFQKALEQQHPIITGIGKGVDKGLNWVAEESLKSEDNATHSDSKMQDDISGKPNVKTTPIPTDKPSQENDTDKKTKEQQEALEKINKDLKNKAEGIASAMPQLQNPSTTIINHQQSNPETILEADKISLEIAPHALSNGANSGSM